MPQRFVCLFFLLPPHLLHRHLHVSGSGFLTQRHLQEEPEQGKQAPGSACGAGDAACGDGGQERVLRWDTVGQAA